MSKVYLGMSGGVDSSVSAILLQEQGYDVTGIYMKNWSQDLPGMKCPWAEDLADAKRVAVQLDLDFEVWDFEADYKRSVVDYMLAEFQKGRTPNPDVVCNELIKFKLFYERALAEGADFIATGHYAQTKVIGGQANLCRAVDENKDQTYFLYRMSDAVTAKTLFPVGSLMKPEVKRLAAARGLDVAHKKESMGICFVGEVGIKDFLQEYLEVKPGEIREQETDKILGYHDGVIYYTIGQRHGLYVGGGLPYYVVQKDLDRNIVYVSRNINHPNLWTTELNLTDLLWRNQRTTLEIAQLPNLQVRLRHRAPLIPVKINQNVVEIASAQDDAVTSRSSLGKNNNHSAASCILQFAEPIKRPAAGQSAVLYSGEICLGGGYIAE